MLALTCERAGIADGQRILDLGCGWGSLSLWMAERYPNADVVAVSNSRTQHQFIMEQALVHGLLNVRHVVLNVADFAKEELDRSGANDLGADWRFDRIVSVEMFEHMRNVDRLLHHLAGWLHPDGRLFVHIFCHRDLFYRFVDQGRNDWMARHFFTGGAMPPLDLFEQVHGPFELETRWEVGGEHYAQTCRAWLENLDAARDVVLRRFQQDLAPADGPTAVPTLADVRHGLRRTFRLRRRAAMARRPSPAGASVENAEDGPRCCHFDWLAAKTAGRTVICRVHPVSGIVMISSSSIQRVTFVFVALSIAAPLPVQLRATEPEAGRRDFSAEAEAAHHADRLEALRDPELRRHYLDQMESRQRLELEQLWKAQLEPGNALQRPRKLPPEIRQLQEAMGGSQVEQFPSLRTEPAANELLRPRGRRSAVAPPEAIRALRDGATKLDEIANRLEQLELYPQADAIREQAQRLRLDAQPDEVGDAGRADATPDPRPMVRPRAGVSARARAGSAAGNSERPA